MKKTPANTRIEELRPLPRNCGTRDRSRDSQGSYKRAQALVSKSQSTTDHSNSLDPHTHNAGFNKSLTSELFTSPTSTWEQHVDRSTS